MEEGEMGDPLFPVCIGHGMMPCTKLGHGRLGKLRRWRGKRGDEIGWEQGGWGQRRSAICGQAPFPYNVYMGGRGAGMGHFVNNNFSPLLPSCSFLPKGAGAEIWSS